VGVTLDDIDRRIIVLLQEDGRMSSREIARRLGGLSDRAVRYRVDRLVKSKVIYIGAVVNNEAIGLPVMGDVLIDVVPWRMREIATRLAAHERVSYVATSAESGTISLQVCTRSEWELQHFVSQVVGALDGVRGTRIFVVPRLLKDCTDWQVPTS